MNELSTETEQTMSSLEISKLTEKEHRNVMRDIKSVLEEAGIDLLKFEQVYKAGNGQMQPCYNLPRRECDLVVSGYSVKYRLAIIDRWHELEAAKKPMSQLEFMLYSAQMMIENDKRVTALEVAKSEQAQTIKEIEARQEAIIEGLKFFTVLGYANLNQINMPLDLAKTIGKEAAKLSRGRGIPIDKVRDPRFGQVNAYSESILAEVIGSML
jgi:phage regulator Rha-like protein